jgi:uncharacterized protein YjbK
MGSQIPETVQIEFTVYRESLKFKNDSRINFLIMIREEKEIKLDLDSEKNYAILVEHFKEKKELHLENSFFDTDSGSLRKVEWALRIRKCNDKYTLTAKGMAKRGSGGLTIRPEIENELEPETAEQMIENGIKTKDIPKEIFNEFKDALDDNLLKKILSFKTLRIIIAYETHSIPIQLEIDKTEYPDGSTDYELEIELPQKDLQDKVLQQIEALLDRLNIPFILQKRSKFARALKKLETENQ